MEKNIRSMLWNHLREHAGSYELKDEVVWRATKAILEKDISRLEGSAVLFKPDDGSLEEVTAGQMATYMKNVGITELVEKEIVEHA